MKNVIYSFFDHLELLVTHGHYFNNNYYFSCKLMAHPADLAHWCTPSLSSRVVYKVNVRIRGLGFLKHEIWQYRLHACVPTTGWSRAAISPFKGSMRFPVGQSTNTTSSLNLILITHITYLVLLSLLTLRSPD